MELERDHDSVAKVFCGIPLDGRLLLDPNKARFDPDVEGECGLQQDRAFVSLLTSDLPNVIAAVALHHNGIAIETVGGLGLEKKFVAVTKVTWTHS